MSFRATQSAMPRLRAGAPYPAPRRLCTRPQLCSRRQYHISLPSCQRSIRRPSKVQSPENQPLLRSFTTTSSRFGADLSKTSASDQVKDAQGKDSAAEDAAKTANKTEPHPQPSNLTTEYPPDHDWENDPNFDIEKFTELPYANFGVNQHMVINQEFKEAMRQMLWRFRAPIRYAFAYGSGVFPQSTGSPATDAAIKAVHSKPHAAIQKAQNGSPKMIDFIFGVQHTQHFHSLNLKQHRDHYSGLGSLGSGAVSWAQDQWGAGVYFNPYVTVDGTLIKYGVVNIDTLCNDLRNWDTLYLAGRLHKPVKILRDHPQVRLANQINLLGALRTALLILPPSFTEQELYATIAGISYLGDPRMAFPTENPRKVANIVNHNMLNFRRLYVPLIESMPNVEFVDPECKGEDWIWKTDAVLRLQQDMDPVKRGNMVRRLPAGFRSKLYFEYQKKFQIPRGEFDRMMEESREEEGASGSFRRQQGGGFERRIALGEPEELRNHVRGVIKKTINWPSTSQTIKSFFTAGISRSSRYMGEKMSKFREGSKENKESKKSS